VFLSGRRPFRAGFERQRYGAILSDLIERGRSVNARGRRRRRRRRRIYSYSMIL
jgi:hypothetical protein